MNVTEPIVHIVDGDAPFLAATSRLLRSSGFAVKTFGSASDFLAQRAEGVKLHRTAIATKLGVQSVAELTRLTDERLLTESKPAFP
jgi:FixJ family two-component response regulator